MGTISQVLRMEDKVSPVFNNISKKAKDLIDEYNKLDKAQSEAVQTASRIRLEYGEDNKMYKQLTKSAEEYANQLNKLVKTGEVETFQNSWYQKWQERQKGVTDEVNATEAAFRRIGSVIKTVIGVYSIRQLMNMSDQLVQTEARLGLALRTNNWNGSASGLSDMIYGAAQRSRSDYNTMASTVAKLGMQAGSSFSNQAELVKFTENLSKIFTVSGLDSGGIQSVMYNLTQSMSSGKLLGNDYRILKMNAPELINMLKNTYADGSQQALDEMVSKGQISAQMLKQAIIGGTEDIENKFKEMPVTWEQAFTSIKNSTQRLLKPVLKIVSGIATTFYNVTTSIEKNWKRIAPILSSFLVLLGGLAAAFVALKIKSTISNIALTISLQAGAKAFLAEAEAASIAGKAVDMHAVASARAAVATNTMIAGIGKLILLLGVAIATAHGASYVVEQVTGESLDAIGIITGAIGMVVGVVVEAAKKILNPCIFLINAVVGYSIDGLNGLKNAWLGFLITILQGVEATAKEIDRVAGTNYAGNNQEGLHRQILELKSEREMLQKDLSWKGIGYLDPKMISSWTKEGYWAGEGFSKSMSTAFDQSELATSITDMMSTDSTGASALKTTTGDSLLKDEDIQLLLDVATRDYKLNYQQITPEITMTFGDIRETADVDAITEELANRLQDIYDSDLEVVAG